MNGAKSYLLSLLVSYWKTENLQSLNTMSFHRTVLPFGCSHLGLLLPGATPSQSKQYLYITLCERTPLTVDIIREMLRIQPGWKIDYVQKITNTEHDKVLDMLTSYSVRCILVLPSGVLQLRKLLPFTFFYAGHCCEPAVTLRQRCGEHYSFTVTVRVRASDSTTTV